MEWLQERLREARATRRLHVLYGIDGTIPARETVLRHFEGYRGSGPVRIGNGASRQLQLDIYGEMMDSVYLYNKYVQPISFEMWDDLVAILGWMRNHWRDKDRGIWEVRSANHQGVHSKLMCWVALDRALRMAEKRSLPLDHARWKATRDAIFQAILKRGWNPRLRSFVQAFGSKRLDASTLLMPMMKFISPTDPRMLSTLDAIQSTLVSDSLVYRYRAGDGSDGLAGREGSFSMCTFWLVECLARAGRVEEARLIFEKMLGYANHLGLFGEEIGENGEALGNFPQAFTHLGLISAAYNLDHAIDPGRKGWS
jgi:GH15 family glucan-1,4-alpha-glucosidase